MKHKHLLLTFALAVVVLMANAQKTKNYEPQTKDFMEARKSLNNNDYPTAYDYLDKEIAANPKSGHAWFLKGWLDMYYKEDMSAALNSFDRSVKLLPRKDKPYRSFAYSGRGTANRSVGNYDAAYRDYSQAIKLYPSDPQNYINRGELFYGLGNYSEALVDFTAGLKQAPDNPDALYGVGKCYLAVKDYERCLRWLEDCIKQHPDYADYYGLMTNCYWAMGDSDKAIHFLEEAIAIEKDESKKAEFISGLEFIREHSQPQEQK